MATTTFRVRTTVCYRGLPVTVLGDTAAGRLLAVVAYDTPHELAIAAIAVKRRRGGRVFAIVGTAAWTADVTAVARMAARQREARDVDELGGAPARG